MAALDSAIDTCKFSESYVRKEDHFTLPPVVLGEDGIAACCGNAKDTFLHPLSFPEAQQTDLSHFIDQARDVPIVCLFPSCNEVFGDMEMDESFEVDKYTGGRVKLDRSTDEMVEVDKSTNGGVKVENECGENIASENDIPKASEGISKYEDCMRASGTQKREAVAMEISKPRFSIKDQWLRHLFLAHKLVLDKANNICSLRR